MRRPHRYADLLRLNAWIRKNADTWYLHCTTRTVQESKLFPVPAYMVVSYLQSFYRYPELLRALDAVMPAENIGDRLREVSTKGNIISLSCIPEFYLAGRQTLIDFGMMKPTDALDDLAFVSDFAERLNLAFHRQHAHVLPSDAGLRAQLLPERRLQVFEADAIAMRPGDRLHTVLKRFMATTNQYALLSHCESRLGIFNHGPYRCRTNEEMLVRGFVDLGECDLPWLDGIAHEIEYNNLALPFVVKDTHFNIVDDWASFEATPAYDHDNVVAVGCYTSDFLSDGEIPVAMDNATVLSEFLEHYDALFAATTRALWERMASWSRDQMIDAGAMMYAGVAKDLFHVAGIYEQSDWFTIDERAQRFKPLLNDEYARDFLASLLGLLNLPSQQGSSYSMNKWSHGAGEMWSPVPYAVLNGGAHTLSAGPLRPGSTSLEPKQGTWLTTRGRLTLHEYNEAARHHCPTVCTDEYRWLDDAWVREHAVSDAADALYHLDQRRSRNLEGRGASLTRADIDAMRAAAEADLSGPLAHSLDDPAFLALHGLAVKKSANAIDIAEHLQVEPAVIDAALSDATTSERIVVNDDKYMLTPAGRDWLTRCYPALCHALRADGAFTAAYERFEIVNRQLLALMTRWQTLSVGGASVPNDHQDADYDAGIINELGDLHDRSAPILDDFATALARLGVYRELLEAAYDRVLDGDTGYVSGARCASYHTVWFELHEDLLRLLGREREEH